MDKEIMVKYGDNEYKQVILPIRSALKLRSEFLDVNDGMSIDLLKMYDVVLKNFFDKEYVLEDFTSTDEVDTICMRAFENQYS